jgi:plastocyanin
MGRSLIIGALVLVAHLQLGCGGSTPSAPSPPTPPAESNPPPPATPPPPPLTAQVTITAAGVAPKEVTVAKGGRVTFINSDSRVHDVYSDPDHLGTDCPSINEAGFLLAGQRRDTGPLTVARDCGYHDHLNTNDESMRGKIIVVEVP